jgi:hypothetical protein
MIVNGKLDSAANKTSGIHVSSSADEEAVIDIASQLVFFTGSRQLKKMKLYTTRLSQTDTAGCSRHSILDKGEGYSVLLCNNIPNVIFPGVLFAGMNGGIRSVSTPTITVRLYYFKERPEGDKRLRQYAKYFREYPVNGIEEGFLED